MMIGFLALLCFILLQSKPCHSEVYVTTEVELNATTNIEQLISSFRIRNPAAKLVRLAFHDCIGGCDGCLNLNNRENNGLADIYNAINTLYNRNNYNASNISRADFIALAGIVGIRQGSLRQSCTTLGLPNNCQLPSPNITMKYGRKDCPSSPSTNNYEQFPDPHGNLTHVLNYFRTQMNMTKRDTVAIMGAHSLGTMSITNSGFNGPWALPTVRFDNGFYRVLSDNNVWFQQELVDMRSPFYPTPRYQWTNGGPGLVMLNSDTALFRDINPDETGLETNTSCRMDFDNCPPSTTAGIVLEFAGNNNAFMEAFGPAFQKLIQTGYNDNELKAAYNMTPSSAIQALSSVFIFGIFTIICFILVY